MLAEASHKTGPKCQVGRCPNELCIHQAGEREEEDKEEAKRVNEENSGEEAEAEKMGTICAHAIIEGQKYREQKQRNRKNTFRKFVERKSYDGGTTELMR